MEQNGIANLKERLNPKKEADKNWYLALLDEETQRKSEEEHLRSLLLMLKRFYLARHRKRITEAKKELEEIRTRKDYDAGDYRALLEQAAEIEALTRKIDSYKCFFTEPYFARMDVVDAKEGYNSYYIGKRGDVNLEIVDWRAPLAVRYYQKSRITFRINDYEYRTVLRRSLLVKNGELQGFKNEYLSVRDVLTPEEIAGRDEEILFDPYLKSIIRDRKDDVRVRDIIRTIQEKQFDIITRPERESFVLQGCAGSGKTMIMLHRLSYLMYNNEALKPRDVLVITPSDSFNAFIDELSQVLELQKVKTTTLSDYYLRALKGEGIDLAAHMGTERENAQYLEYLYSAAFPADVKREIGKIYGDMFGLFAAPECREVAEKVLYDCKKRQELYLKVKNASVRVRRCVLGELKENTGGGFYFTKPFRGLMSHFVQAEDFLSYVLHEQARTPDYFFRQFMEFYRSSREICAQAEQVFEGAQADLTRLTETVEREIADLKRYRRKINGEEVYTYTERIARRRELCAEIGAISEVVGKMGDGVELFHEFFAIIRLSKTCSDAGKCANACDLVRWLYRRTVRPAKQKYGMKGVYPSDGYALCTVLVEAGRQLTPRYGLVFVDEGQDVSADEYRLLRRIHADAAFNIFGDLKQNITPWRGVSAWEGFGTLYELYRNYRNTNEIVEFVSAIPGVDMSPIGLKGEPVAYLTPRKINAFFKDRQGLKAVIAREEYLPLFAKRGFVRLAASGTLSQSKINVMSVYESKGLEFSAVAVYDRDMTDNEKYIAYTRALSVLGVVRDAQ